MMNSVIMPVHKIHPTAIVHPNAVIGKNVEIGAYAIVGDDVVIGDGCKLYPHAVIHEHTTVGKNCTFVATLAGHVTVEDRAVIGGLAAVHQFCKIGRSAMIGGQAHVNQDVPPFMIVSGQPAYVFGLNSVGLARAGIPQAERSQLKKAFRILYRSGLSLQEAIATMEQELDSCEPVEHLMRFLRTAERGILRTPKN